MMVLLKLLRILKKKFFALCFTLKDIINQIDGIDQVVVSLLVRIRMDKGISTIDSTHSILLSDIKKLNIPIITFSFGSPYLPDYEVLDTYVCTFGYGSITMQAAADALWGRQTINGTLPVKLNSKFLQGSGVKVKKRVEAWGEHLKNDFPKAWGVLDSAIENRIFPGAQVFIAKNGNIMFNGGFGNHSYDNGSPHVSENSIYDIASITKVISITPIIMKLISKKKLSIDQPIYYFLPSFTGNSKENVTIKHLLTHSSGIKSYYKFFLEEEIMDRKDIVNNIINYY